MRLPTSGGEDMLAATIGGHFSTYTLERLKRTSGPMGGSEGQTTVDVSMWVFDPSEIREETEYGDRLSGSLGGLTSPSADVQVNDRLTYQGETYEVAETMTFDGQHGDVYTMCDLVRMENV